VSQESECAEVIISNLTSHLSVQLKFQENTHTAQSTLSTAAKSYKSQRFRILKGRITFGKTRTFFKFSVENLNKNLNFKKHKKLLSQCVQN
jgi:hypothetical protein